MYIYICVCFISGLSLFSLVSFPFSLKIIWAPIVDCLYIPSFGRRKTWLIPVQLLTGAVMIAGAPLVNKWIGEPGPDGANQSKIQIQYLVPFFFFLYFLMATQDIAVDGWALTMLSRDNVGYASLCNSIGQSLGVFLANQGFIALSDPLWCQQFLGFSSDKPFLTLDRFMLFWGWVFIVVTLLVLVGKSEGSFKGVCSPGQETSHGKSSGPIKLDGRSTPDKLEGANVNSTVAPDDDEPDGLVETLRQLYSIFKLPPIHTLCLVLLTCKVAFSAADAVSTFKLQEYGMPKTELSMISPLLMAVGFIIPMVSGKVISSSPLRVLSVGIKLKLFTSALRWLMVQLCRVVYQSDNLTTRYTFFYSLVVSMVLHEAAGNLIFISFMTFFSKISDANIGGTYMTFLNTINNLGYIWPTSLALWLLPKLTLYAGTVHEVDGYTVESLGCIVIGLFWLRWFQPRLLKLESTHHKEWSVSFKSTL